MVESGELWDLVERTWREASFQKAIQREGHQIAARRRCIMMFMGEYNHTIDTKGRLIIPAKFREQLGNEFVVTKGLDGCLFVFPQNEWESFQGKLKTLPLINKDARKFSRFFMAGAAPCEMDKQGRTLVPATLREFAQMKKEVVLTGMADRIEIWSKEKWIENNSYEDMDDIAASMQELGLSI